MSRRIAALLATVVAGLMAVGIANAAIGPATDDSTSTTSITSSTAPSVTGGVETGVADDSVGNGSTSTTVPDDSGSPSTTVPPAADDGASSATFNAGDGGTVTIASNGSSLTITSVDPAPGWSFEIEVSSGVEVEADFRNGTRRIQFNAQLEDGEVRVRVRSDNSG